jgi:hypothetical protein
MATDADQENGPAARSLAADAHDCNMVRIKRSYRIQVCGTKVRPIASSPRVLRRRGSVKRRSFCKKNPSQFIIAARAQASRRCETQATLGGTPPSCATVSVPLTPSARSANLIAGDGTKNGFPAPNKEPTRNQNHYLTGKAPYKFESAFPLAVSQERTVARSGLTARQIGLVEVSTHAVHTAEEVNLTRQIYNEYSCQCIDRSCIPGRRRPAIPRGKRTP